MSEKLAFIRGFESGLYTMTELCRQYGIAPKTGYKWLRRYEKEGEAGLEDRSRAPKSCPHRTPSEIADKVVAERKKHPRWGPKKLLDRLQKRHPDKAWPAPSTAGEILRKAGLVKPKRRRRAHPHPGRPEVAPSEPNDLWTIDFKGEFRLGNGRTCYPLTVQDRLTRFILACHGLPGTVLEGTKAHLLQLFLAVGLPLAILSDNGSPFVGHGLAGLSQLNVWLMHLGIRHIRTQRGHPEQNPCHERMHRDLKDECCYPPEYDFGSQEKRFDGFRHGYNFERPHEALGQQRPAELWVPSPRRLVLPLADPCYPGHCEVRRVRSGGEIKFKGDMLFISQALQGMLIAMEPIAYHQWALIFNGFELARYSEDQGRFV